MIIETGTRSEFKRCVLFTVWGLRLACCFRAVLARSADSIEDDELFPEMETMGTSKCPYCGSQYPVVTIVNKTQAPSPWSSYISLAADSAFPNNGFLIP
jgi:hypothetical protein